MGSLWSGLVGRSGSGRSGSGRSGSGRSSSARSGSSRSGSGRVHKQPCGGIVPAGGFFKLPPGGCLFAALKKIQKRFDY